MKNAQLLAKIGGGSLIALLSVATVPEAKAAHIVDVTGTPGAGFTTWTFSGSDTATDNGNFRVIPSNTLSSNDSTEISSFGSSNNGKFIADSGIQDQSFPVLLGSATITAGGNSQSIGGIFLDDDSTENFLDDIGFRTATSSLNYSLDDTISIVGTITIGVDFNQLNEGNYISTTFANFLSEPLQLNISEVAATTPEPSALIGLFAVGGLGLLSRKKKQK